MNFVAAILYAASTSALLAVVLGLFGGGLNPSSAGLALSAGLVVASATFWKGRTCHETRAPPSAWEWVAILSFVFVTLRIFLWVVFVQGDEIMVLSPNNLGDLSLHLTYIQFIANGAPFWPDNPIFAGHPLTYPLGVDLLHSLVVLLGGDPLRAFVWFGLIGSALTGVALWRWGRGFVLFGFIANGGLAALEILETGALTDFQAPHAWKSFALALLATQRGLLFALPAGLLLLGSWRARFFSGDDQSARLPVWGEVLLYASLPLFHFHTFLFLSVLLGSWFLLHAPARRGLLVLVGAAFVPATALVWLITGGLNGGRVLGWKPGWMMDDPGFLDWCQRILNVSDPALAAVIFWPLNFGILPILVIALLIHLWRERDDWARAVVFPAVGIFLVCCFVKFAPWEWDNTKLMVWAYLAVLPFIWSKGLAHWSRWTQAAAVFALFGSGILSTLGGLDATHRGHAIASRYELAGTRQALRAIPLAERFAGAPTYNHPLLLSGRKMVVGYLGHVESHGLEWQDTAAQLDGLMRGFEDWRSRADTLQVRYLFWGKPENEAYADSSQPWRTEVRIVAAGEWGAIYDLQSPPDPSAVFNMQE